VPRRDLPLRVFRRIDDELQARALPRLRPRGPRATAPTDAGVITAALVGEFWGLDADRTLVRRVRDYHRDESPAPPAVHRTTFARRAANPRAVKPELHRRPAARLAAGDPAGLIDGLPPEVGRFARAASRERFTGPAEYGDDRAEERASYGFRPHPRASRAGVIEGFGPAPARAAELAARGVRFPAPFQRKSRGPDPERSARSSAIRYRPEAVDGRLAGRSRVKRVWARDLWHPTHRVTRRVLRRTAVAWLGVRAGLSPPTFDGLCPAA
jgi:hypothetical protein